MDRRRDYFGNQEGLVAFSFCIRSSFFWAKAITQKCAEIASIQLIGYTRNSPLMLEKIGIGKNTKIQSILNPQVNIRLFIIGAIE